MRALPSSLLGPDNDLSDQLEHFIQRAIQEPDATVYAFGQRWGPEPQTRDKIFNFLPGLGIHDIHMNQGNVPPFLGDDGVWQDGGLVLQFPSTQQWVAALPRVSVASLAHGRHDRPYQFGHAGTRPGTAARPQRTRPRGPHRRRAGQSDWTGAGA